MCIVLFILNLSLMILPVKTQESDIGGGRGATSWPFSLAGISERASFLPSQNKTITRLKVPPPYFLWVSLVNFQTPHSSLRLLHANQLLTLPLGPRLILFNWCKLRAHSVIKYPATEHGQYFPLFLKRMFRGWGKHNCDICYPTDHVK